MATATRRAALYVRVSTSDRGQTVEKQLAPLQEAAGRLGWTVVAIFRDEGISGSQGRAKRPGLDALLKGVARRDFDIVASWSVGRLGRSLSDLIGLLGELRSRDIDLYLHQQALDTSTPSGRALFGMLGVFSEFERAMIRDRVMAGLDRARSSGKRDLETPDLWVELQREAQLWRPFKRQGISRLDSVRLRFSRCTPVRATHYSA